MLGTKHPVKELTFGVLGECSTLMVTFWPDRTMTPLELVVYGKAISPNVHCIKAYESSTESTTGGIVPVCQLERVRGEWLQCIRTGIGVTRHGEG